MKFFNYIKKHPIFFSVAILVILIIGAFGVRIKRTKAIVPSPFGGKITSVVYCPCSANLAITVGPPKGGIFSVEPEGIILYPFYKIFSAGAWELGTYTTGGVCLTPAPPGECVPMAYPIGTIEMAGTSL